MYDIIIVGLGPAGAVLARSLDSRFSVLAIDRKQEGGGFKKPCGGLLAPDAQKELASLGLNLPKEILVDPQIFSVRTIDLDNSLIRNYQRMYINLDRHKFDMWLIESLPENIVRAEGVVTGIEKTEEGYRVTYISEGVEKTASRKYKDKPAGRAIIVPKPNGQLMFRLVDETEHAPNPRVMPTVEVLSEVAGATVRRTLPLLLRKKN